MSDEDGIRKTIANYGRLFDSHNARADSDFLGVEDNKILAVGTYADVLTKSGDSWLLASKEIRLK
jgi:predicted amidohydrolase YtcJ